MAESKPSVTNERTPQKLDFGPIDSLTYDVRIFPENEQFEILREYFL